MNLTHVSDRIIAKRALVSPQPPPPPPTATADAAANPRGAARGT